MGAAQDTAPMLQAIAARCLKLTPEAINPSKSLACYGLDSLNAVELALAFGTINGIEIDEETLRDAPSINELAQRLRLPPDAGESGRASSGNIYADARLPEDIDPAAAAPLDCGASLLTGATGFLGAHLLAALIERGVSMIYCPIRAHDDAHARQRLAAALKHYGLGASLDDHRVIAFAARLEDAQFGCPAARYYELAVGVADIYHCAAQVNWALAYDALRESNVEVTKSVLRFASTASRKRFCFISSAAACYSTRSEGAVIEERPAANPEGIHLGYGQSKWVAERLVEQAAARGLQTIIVRPSLIAGAAGTGVSNDDDFLARMLRGCIALGHAPEIDWRIDACPVDFAAASIAALGARWSASQSVVHLRNPRDVLWSEAVLWMNLRGYPVKLEPFEAWLARVERHTRAADHPLYPLRAFLLHRPEGEDGRTLPQIYADSRIARLDAARSERELGRLGLVCPRLSAHLLERYFEGWVCRGVLARVGRDADTRPGPESSVCMREAIARLLCMHYADHRVSVSAMRDIELGSAHSILGELTAWRAGAEHTMRTLGLTIEQGGGQRHDLELVLKPKARADVVLAVTQEVATLCDPALGEAFAAYAQASELAGTERREIAIYLAARDTLAAHMPVCYGVAEVAGVPTLVMERITRCDVIDAVERVDEWTPARIEAAVTGIARVHAEWLGREDAVHQLLGDAPRQVVTTETVRAWHIALARYARPWFERWLGPSAAARHIDLAHSGIVEHLAQPRTLIHNDFNPRNIALVRSAAGLELKAFDWELACWGLPQRDLAELLCFTLAPDTSCETVERYVQLHRQSIQCAAHVALNRRQWNDGLRTALLQFGIERLPMYLIAHRFRPQKFLERVARTWRMLECHVTT